MTEHLIRIEIACSGRSEAAHLSAVLLEARLAACVQTRPIISRYHWEGRIAEDEEVLMVAKTRKSLFGPICDVITDAHSYEVPEIIAVDIACVNADYAQWVIAETRAP